MSETSVLDNDSLRIYFGPRGEWARACGQRVKAKRIACHMTILTLATQSHTTAQTIQRVENGSLVPRERLRASISFALMTEPQMLWPYPTLVELAAVAS